MAAALGRAVATCLCPRKNFPNEATLPGLGVHVVVLLEPLLCRRVLAAVAAGGARWRYWLVALARALWCGGFGAMVLMRAAGPGYVDGPKVDPPEAPEPPRDADGCYRGPYYDRPQYCDVCRVVQPAGCGHCAVCRRCVRDFDHHCTICDLCVGARNQWLFVAMIAAHVAAVATMALVALVHAADAARATRLALVASPAAAGLGAAFAASVAYCATRRETRALLGTLASCDWFRIYGLRHDGPGACASCAPCCAVVASGAAAACCAVRVDEVPGDASLASLAVALVFVCCAAVVAPCGISVAWFMCEGFGEGITSRLLWRRRKDAARAAEPFGAGGLPDLPDLYARPPEDAERLSD